MKLSELKERAAAPSPNGYTTILVPRETVLNLLKLLEDFAGLANEAVPWTADGHADELENELAELLKRKEGDL